MYLKRLELQGFKTFADRTELEFTPGITAIVGPNGSGKSNVFDAIRWALGEMSFKSLRSGRMDDVIFGGSEARRAMGMGEVSLTINNDSGALPVEYAEVTVTRRANRGGEGEYLLNTVSCRLRDIQMLFLGTGLGGRSYSLIGQGQVDSVLNAGPDDRRALLEEAAGLARYKRRRREAERRLAHAATNLLRVQDVLAELTVQLEGLREQAAAASAYQAHTREARELELALQVEDGRRILATLRRLSTQTESVREQLQTLAGQGAETGRQIDEDRARAGEAARQWEDAQRALLQIVEDLSGRESALQVLAERLRAADAQRDRLAADVQRLDTQREQLDETVTGLRAQTDSLQFKRDALREQMHQAEEAQDRSAAEQQAVEEQLAGMRSEIADLLAARTRAAHDLARLDERLAGIEEQAVTLAAKQDALASAEDRIAATVSELRQTLATLQQRREEASSRVEALHLERRNLEQRADSCQDEMRQLQADRQVVAQTLSFLDEMHRRLAGYEQGVREILMAKAEHPERFTGIRYPVLELLRVDAPHRAAIEAALGRRLFSLVASSVEDVKGGLTYLRGNGQGSASFIPVDLLTPRAQSALPSGAEIVGRATELVEVTNGARDVVEALLGDVAVVTSLDVAVALRAQGYAGRIATLDGELLSPDGVISFRGRPDGDALLLGRREQIASLRERQTQIDAALLRVESERADVTEHLAILDGSLTAAEADALRADEVIAAQQVHLVPLQGEAARVPVERGEVEAALALLRAEQDRVQVEIARLRRDEAELEQAALEREQAAGQADAALRGATEHMQISAARLTEVRVQLAELMGTIDALHTREAEYTREGKELAARADHLQGEMAVLDGERHLLAHSREDAERQRAALAEQQDATRTVLATVEEERAVLQQRLLTLEATWRQVQDALHEVEEQAHRLEVRHAQVDTEFTAAARRISEEFGIGWDEVREIRLPGSRDEALGRVEALRGLIAALGPVNLRAVEEYAAVAARAEALRAQSDDLERARTSLGALMQRLDEVLRMRFAQTFEAVNDEFNRLFVRLFAGGRAQLLLVDGEPGRATGLAAGTEPGIEIEAQLPGKKMRSLSALSGGERVLVALALIFAMLRVHPSPFCIFDEVEAALDDANTRKFTTLLRELAGRTQVLIITHNKGTMEAADVLYGVTMELPGVSKIISMRLTHKGLPEPVAVS